MLVTKDPDATLDYSVDWSTWLADGDTVSTAAWVLPTGVASVAEFLGAGIATLWMSGGTAGERYTVTCRATTAQGRIDDRSIEVAVMNR